MVRSNFCISTMPLTTSVLSSRPAMPSRGRKPTWFLATSDNSTGKPPCCVSTMLSMSLTEVRTPSPRTFTDCSPSEMVRPPTLELLARDRGDDLRQREVEGPHAVEIDLGLEFLGLAAEHQHVGDAGHQPQPALHHPVLQGAKLDQVHVRRPDQLVAEDFADRAGRRDHRLHAGRKLDVLQPVERLLPHEIVVAAVFELQPDEAQRKHRIGADEFQPRRAGDRDLDRNRDVALDLLRRLAGILRDDLDDRRRRIGIGLDVHGARTRRSRSPRNAANAISTSGRRDRQVEIRLRIMAGL